MKTLLKQSKLSEKLILNEDEDILLDDEENNVKSNISKEDEVINNILFRYEEEDTSDEDVRNEMILDIIEELYPDLEAYTSDWDNVYRIYEEKLNCILDGKCESLKEDVKEDDLLELEEPIDEEPIEDEPINNIEEPVESVTQEVADNAYLTQINDLITAEYGKIDEVKSIIATFTTEDAIDNNSEVISILNSFIDETTIGIGMLTKATELIDSTTNDLMQQGIEKAENAISDVNKEETEEKTEE